MQTLPEITVEGAGELPTSTIDSVGEALTRYGFVLLRHPAVDQALLQRVREQAAQVFALGDPRKRALTNASVGAQPRGHSVFGAQRALNGHPGELKEAWHSGPPEAGPNLAPNIWPKELATFQAVTETSFEALHEVGCWVLRCCEHYLQLPQGHLAAMVDQGPGLLRMLSYPRLRGGHPRIGTLRTAAHTDSCLLTVMGSPSHPGLEIQTPDDHWIQVPERPGAVIVNCGDILEIVSEGKLRSASHRVITRGADQSERFAMPLFMIPRHDVQLELLAKNDEAPCSTTVGEYLAKRLTQLPRY